jgi:predicted acetyltransferase
MKLVEPTKEYEASWRMIVKEFRSDNKTIKLWEVLGDPNDFDGCILTAKKHAQGIDLPADWVPYNIYWLIDDGEIVGLVSIRHRLNEFLAREGGHIGYEIVPSKRGKGYGNVLLELSLQKARGLGMNKVLLTSYDINDASWKIIEKMGGKLENKIKVKGEDALTRRYWINL